MGFEKLRATQIWKPYISQRKIGYMLLLNINRKPYSGNTVAPSHWTLSDFKCESPGHSDFKVLYLVKEHTLCS